MTPHWNWPGSRWYKFDLHTHSPASYDFKPVEARKAADWSAWVAAFKEVGLDAVALTDHNTPSGIDAIKKASLDSGLVVFPGVEVTVGGVHILCVFDPIKTQADVIAFLAKIGIEPRSYGSQENASAKSIVETIKSARDSGAIVIAAHVNGPNGLVMLESGERRKALMLKELAAVEVMMVKPSCSGPWLGPDEPGLDKWLNGANIDRRKITRVWNSDAHEHKHAGRCFTWIKMTVPNAEGLRLALLDGEESVRCHDASIDPNKHASCVIEQITVHSAKYIGRSKPFHLSFNPWFNSLIGGRGVGKSTIIDFLRCVFRREDELGKSGDTSLRAAFEKRMRVPGSKGDEGLLTPTTRVEVVYRKDGQCYLVTWSQDGTAPSIERLDGETRVAEPGDSRTRFPIRVYGQKQLFDLAKDPYALLSVIDGTAEVHASDLGKFSDKSEAAYLSLQAEARLRRARVQELPEQLAVLGDVRRKIAILQEDGNAKALGHYQIFQTRNSHLNAAFLRFKDGTVAIENLVESLDLGQEPSDDGDVKALGTDIFNRLTKDQSRVLGELQASVSSAVEEARAKMEQIRVGTDLAVWRNLMYENEEAYKKAAGHLEQAGVASPDEYSNLVKRATVLERDIAVLESLKDETADLERRASVELALVRTCREELAKRRSEFAVNASSDLIKVEIAGLDNRDNFESYLRDVLGIARFDDDYRLLVAHCSSDHGMNFSKLDKLVGGLRALQADSQHPWKGSDRRFEVALRKVQPERIDRVALYLPEDTVDVSFRDARDTKSMRWKKLSQGSPGQQTAALLAFVLGYGTEPIILDQPEDDLDNALIYDLVVKRLREKKLRRQVIVATHNPNIVVHCDSELVLSLGVCGGQTCVNFAGGMQETKGREEICRVMEGGHEAFSARFERICGRMV